MCSEVIFLCHCGEETGRLFFGCMEDPLAAQVKPECAFHAAITAPSLQPCARCSASTNTTRESSPRPSTPVQSHTTSIRDDNTNGRLEVRRESAVSLSLEPLDENDATLDAPVLENGMWLNIEPKIATEADLRAITERSDILSAHQRELSLAVDGMQARSGSRDLAVEERWESAMRMFTRDAMVAEKDLELF